MMQAFMVKKGLIDSSLNEEEIKEFLQTSDLTEVSPAPPVEKVDTSSNQGSKTKERHSTSPLEMLERVQNARPRGKKSLLTQAYPDNASEVTVYKKAVRQLNPELDLQIENLLQQTHLESNGNRKESSSSNEFLDTSDKGINGNLLITQQRLTESQYHFPIISDARVQQPSLTVKEKTTQPSAQEQADKMVLNAERSRGHMFEVPGKIFDQSLGHTQQINQVEVPLPAVPSVSIFQIDQDYQMIDLHLDDNLRRTLEYMDFAQLIPKGKSIRDDDG